MCDVRGGEPQGLHGGLPSRTTRGRPSGPTTVCFPHQPFLRKRGSRVRLELREGLALGLCAVHGVGDIAQDVEAGGLGDGEHLGVLGRVGARATTRRAAAGRVVECRLEAYPRLGTPLERGMCKRNAHLGAVGATAPPGNRETRPGSKMRLVPHVARVSWCPNSATPRKLGANPPPSRPCRDWLDCLAEGRGATGGLRQIVTSPAPRGSLTA